MKCFRTLGKKGEKHANPEDPPRKRANKQRGHGTYDNDRPPIVGTVGRESGQVRLRVIHNTDRKTLEAHVHRFTLKETTCYTDEWNAYNHIIREHSTVCHAKHEWARDDDGDGIREVHTNTAEGMWTDVRNYLRPFKGVHKKYLSGYVAMAEFRRNLKRIFPAFTNALVTLHSVYT
jgi:transposase-like protein